MIHILLRRQKDKIDVSIADNGPGMSEEVKRRVFEKFYQGDNSRSAQGSGLGLALAKRIVPVTWEEVNPEDYAVGKKGTTFTVILPTLPEREE